jgi:pimeloyl-ACP methyl ester carboxylesterase
LRTWADDLQRLYDALGLRKPVVLGSSFCGAVVQRIFAGDAEDSQAEFNRVCYPL